MPNSCISELNYQTVVIMVMLIHCVGSWSNVHSNDILCIHSHNHIQNHSILSCNNIHYAHKYQDKDLLRCRDHSSLNWHPHYQELLTQKQPQREQRGYRVSFFTKMNYKDINSVAMLGCLKKFILGELTLKK